MATTPCSPSPSASTVFALTALSVTGASGTPPSTASTRDLAPGPEVGRRHHPGLPGGRAHRRRRPTKPTASPPARSRRAVDRAGCYVPGGRAVYPSTVLMTVIPAKVAGVPWVSVCVPPGPDGRVPDVVLAAAAIAGADAVHPVGGAQAIAALAYGTESIPRRRRHRRAGQRLRRRGQAGGRGRGPRRRAVGLRRPLGGRRRGRRVPSPPTFAAVDVIVQAEHGPDGLAWLITWDEVVADAVEAEVARLVAGSPRRAEIEATLDTSGISVLVDSPRTPSPSPTPSPPSTSSCSATTPEALVPLVRHAGAVFCGPLSPAVDRRLLRRPVARAADRSGRPASPAPSPPTTSPSRSTSSP